MSGLNTIGRTVQEIEADLAPIRDEQKALAAREEPLMLELLRAKVHTQVADAASVVLYATEWDNGWFYGSDFDITATDGEVIAWADVIDDPSTDATEDDITDVFLADLSTLFGASEGQTVLTVDLVRLKATAGA